MRVSSQTWKQQNSDGGFLSGLSVGLRERVLMVVDAGRRISEEVPGPDEMNAVQEGGARPPDLIRTIQGDVERGVRSL